MNKLINFFRGDRRRQGSAIAIIVILLALIIFPLGGSNNSSSINSSPTSGMNSSSRITSSMPSNQTSNSTTNAPATVMMTFDSKGGSAVPAQTITNFQPNIAPANPNKEFHYFDGWYFDEAYTRKVEFTDFAWNPAAADLTVYAKWTVYTASIRYVYYDASNYEQIAKSYSIPMFTCKDDYNLEAPTLPTSNYPNQYTYGDWDTSVLPDCLNSLDHVSIKIVAPKNYKEYTVTYALPTYIEKAIDVEYPGSYTMVALTPEYDIYSTGSNLFNIANETGVKDRNATGTFKLNSLFTLNENEHVIDIISMTNDEYTRSGLLFFTNQGRLFDLNNLTSHGGTNDLTEITANFEINEGETIVEVDAGENFVMVRTSANRLIARGELLGLGINSFSQIVKRDLTTYFEASDVAYVTVGFQHGFVVSTAGEILLFGTNTYGSLGNPDYDFEDLTPLTLFSNVTLVKALYNRSYIIGDEEGSSHKLYSTGQYTFFNDQNSSSGSDSWLQMTAMETTNDYFNGLQENESIVQITGSKLNTVYITNLGRTITNGENTNQILGLDVVTQSSPTLNYKTLRDVTTSVFPITTTTAPHYFFSTTNEGTLVITNDGSEIYGSGRNHYKLLGEVVGNNENTNGVLNTSYLMWEADEIVTKKYGDVVKIADPAPITGMTFKGWALYDKTRITLTPGGFSGINMPSYNLVAYAVYQMAE